MPRAGRTHQPAFRVRLACETLSALLATPSRPPYANEHLATHNSRSSGGPRERGTPAVTSDDTPPTLPGELARQLFAPDPQVTDETCTVLVGVCERVTGNLRDAVGEDACSALLLRALARTQFEHPALKDLRPQGGNDIRFDAIPASAARHGTAVVTTAVEALLTALIEILSSLIGADMVLNLLKHDRAVPPARDTGATS